MNCRSVGIGGEAVGLVAMSGFIEKQKSPSASLPRGFLLSDQISRYASNQKWYSARTIGVLAKAPEPAGPLASLPNLFFQY